MAGEAGGLSLRAGQIVLADWRGDALPKEPNKLRPAVVVEDDGLFAPGYPNVLLVPLSDDAGLVIADLAVADRADGGERVRQAVLGGVAPGGDHVEAARHGNRFVRHGGAACADTAAGGVGGGGRGVARPRL